MKQVIHVPGASKKDIVRLETLALRCVNTAQSEKAHYSLFDFAGLDEYGETYGATTMDDYVNLLLDIPSNDMFSANGIVYIVDVGEFQEYFCTVSSTSITVYARDGEIYVQVDMYSAITKRINKIIENEGIDINDIINVIGGRHKPIVCMHSTNDGIVITPKTWSGSHIGIAPKIAINNNDLDNYVLSAYKFTTSEVKLVAEYANSEDEPDYFIIITASKIFIFRIHYAEYERFEMIRSWDINRK